jgi:predicted nucleotidyltransferase
MSSLEDITPKIVKILRKNDVAKAGLFGSYARGEDKKNSDIDILVELDEGLNLLDYIRIKHELEDETGKNIDLVEYSTIKPIIRDQILSEEIRII